MAGIHLNTLSFFYDLLIFFAYDIQVIPDNLNSEFPKGKPSRVGHSLYRGVVSRNPHPSIQLYEPTRDAGRANSELR
jgi:hypothetical protein